MAKNEDKNELRPKSALLIGHSPELEDARAVLSEAGWVFHEAAGFEALWGRQDCVSCSLAVVDLHAPGLKGIQNASGGTGEQSLIGESAPMAQMRKAIDKVAHRDSTVLLQGESGTGKELVARELHRLSARAPGPFVAINCGAIPENLIESELFGHVKGAFTGAERDKPGLVEAAHKGTLFLDEVGELTHGVQAKLLRFLQESEVRRVGDTHGFKVDVRVVAATARDLEQMVVQKQFREDLFYRLNVVLLRMPPLRKRRADIPLLVDFFLHRIGPKLKRGPMTISEDAMQVLVNHAWPGNVRELENTVERALVMADGG